jgi:hypothetical protein
LSLVALTVVARCVTASLPSTSYFLPTQQLVIVTFCTFGLFSSYFLPIFR